MGSLERNDPQRGRPLQLEGARVGGEGRARAGTRAERVPDGYANAHAARCLVIPRLSMKN